MNTSNPSSKFRDVVGRELFVGDLVMSVVSNRTYMVPMEIVRFTSQKVRVIRCDGGKNCDESTVTGMRVWGHQKFRYPHQLILVRTVDGREIAQPNLEVF